MFDELITSTNVNETALPDSIVVPVSSGSETGPIIIVNITINIVVTVYFQFYLAAPLFERRTLL